MSSGTSVTWAGFTASTSSTKRASGLPSMLNSRPGNSLAISAASLRHVAAADVALVRPGMDGDAVGAGLERDPAHADDARPRQVAPVAEHGDGVDIDGEMAGHLAAPVVSGRCCLPTPTGVAVNRDVCARSMKPCDAGRARKPRVHIRTARWIADGRIPSGIDRRQIPSSSRPACRGVWTRQGAACHPDQQPKRDYSRALQNVRRCPWNAHSSRSRRCNAP